MHRSSSPQSSPWLFYGLSLRQLFAPVLAALFAASPAWSGSLYRGTCYASPLDASMAVALDASIPVPFFAQSASGTGGSISYSYGSVALSCSGGTQFSAPVLTCSRVVAGRFGLPSVSSGTATSYVATGSTTTGLFFPACDTAGSGSSPLADQVAAINGLFGPALALLAVIWGGKHVYSLLMSRSAARRPDDEV